MSAIKKITANAIVMMAIAPCFLIFNEGEGIWVNLIGIAYATALCRFGSRIAPKFVREYLASL